jgi:O-acetyl-ADP-ribose deacetylase (regulator of RNase III)
MRFDVIEGNIARESAHGLVNTVGPECRMECGVSGELRSQTNGPILNNVKQEQPFESGEVVVTDAYDLPARYLFHAVPMSQDGSATEHSIRGATKSILEQAESYECRSLVLPLLGCGGGGYDLQAGARCICTEIQQFEPDSLADVRVISHTSSDFEQVIHVVGDLKSVSASP